MIRILMLVLLLSVTAQADGLARPALRCSVEGETRQVASASLCTALGKRLLRPVRLVDGAVADGESVRFVRTDIHWTVVWADEGRPRAWTRLSQAELLRRPVATLVRTAVWLSTTRACKPDEQSEQCRLSARELLDPWPEVNRVRARRLPH